MEAADKLGYRPNAIARGLITQRSNMVAVVISKLTNLYYPEVLVQLTQRFSERGVRVLLFALDRESDTSASACWERSTAAASSVSALERSQ